MSTIVQVVLIICITLVVILAIGAFAKKGDK